LYSANKHNIALRPY